MNADAVDRRLAAIPVVGADCSDEVRHGRSPNRASSDRYVSVYAHSPAKKRLSARPARWFAVEGGRYSGDSRSGRVALQNGLCDRRIR